MKMRSILSSGKRDDDLTVEENGLDAVMADGEKFIPEDEALAISIISATRFRFRDERLIHETPSLTEKQKQKLTHSINFYRDFAEKLWLEMENPASALTYFDQYRTGLSGYREEDLPRWIEALTWSPVKIEDSGKEGPGV